MKLIKIIIPLYLLLLFCCTSNKIESLKKKAKILAKTNNIQGAIKIYQQVLLLDSKDAIANLNIGVLYMDLDILDSAKMYINKAIKINAKFGTAYYNRGILSDKLGNIQNAVNDFTTCIDINKNPNAYVYRGVLYGELAKEKEELQDYNSAIKLDSTSDFAYLNRGSYYFNKKKYLQSKDDFIKGLKQNEGNDEAWVNLGMNYEELDLIDSALYIYTKALTINENNTRALLSRAVLYCNNKKYDLAKIDFYNAELLGDEEAVKLKQIYLQP